MARKPSVYWTDEEQEKLIEHMIGQYLAGEWFKEGSKFRFGPLRKAQEAVLPPERHKLSTSLCTDGNFGLINLAAKRARKLQAQQRTAAIRPPVVEAPKEEPSALTPMPDGPSRADVAADHIEEAYQRGRKEALDEARAQMLDKLSRLPEPKSIAKQFGAQVGEFLAALLIQPDFQKAIQPFFERDPNPWSRFVYPETSHSSAEPQEPPTPLQDPKEPKTPTPVAPAEAPEPVEAKAPKHNPEPAQETKVRIKPRVLLVGVPNDWYRQIEAELLQHVRPEVWDDVGNSRGGVGRLKQLATSLPAAFVYRMASHSTTRIVKVRSPSFHYHEGGIQTLLTNIINWAKSYQEEAPESVRTA